MPNQTDDDVNIYALVHHVLDASREYDETVERRTGRRRRYSCLQWVAPYRNGRLPEASEFTRVQCIDLSSGGFAFLAEEGGDYEFLVVALGNPPSLFLSAESVRRCVVPFEGKNRVQLGCRFVAKLDVPEYSPKLPVPVKRTSASNDREGRRRS
jgi:hypothetical protein